MDNIGDHPVGYTQCGNDWRYRPIDDIGDEMIAIQQYVVQRGWQISGFEPANEPNVEWYFNRTDNACTDPCYTVPDPWPLMDEYFARVRDYVRNNEGALTVNVLTPPMAQGANAESNDVSSNAVGCPPYDFSGYVLMTSIFNAPSQYVNNDGYSWHNYFMQAREQWHNCPTGMHVAMWFPQNMQYNIQSGLKPAYITESDLGPPQFQWPNPITNKDVNPTATANSIRDFLDYERNYSGGFGARRIAVWLLNDNTGEPKAAWAQAWNGTAFRPWFYAWWYTQEPHIP